jgi:cobaltochelatase CobS
MDSITEQQATEMARSAEVQALCQSHTKDEVERLAREKGWRGDPARTSKEGLAQYIADRTIAGDKGTMTATAAQARADTATSGAVSVPPQQASTDRNVNAVAAAVAAALAGLKLGADPEDIRRIVKEELKDAAENIRREVRAEVRQVTVTRLDGTKVDVGVQHAQFPDLLTMVQSGCNVFIAGPAGSGKTTAAEALAKALGLPFYFNGAIDTEYKLTGFVDAQGRVVSTAFRKAYTEGGVYLFDEVDASLPGALLAFNAALSNGHCDFPGSAEPVKRHKDFHCVAAANTWGYGATVEYVGRNSLDKAFMDRFVKLAWGYDSVLERKLAGNDDWTDKVQALRHRAKEKGLKVVISPRASINGAKLLAVGMSKAQVIQATVGCGLSDEQQRNLGIA